MSLVSRIEELEWHTRGVHAYRLDLQSEATSTMRVAAMEILCCGTTHYRRSLPTQYPQRACWRPEQLSGAHRQHVAAAWLRRGSLGDLCPSLLDGVQAELSYLSLSLAVTQWVSGSRPSRWISSERVYFPMVAMPSTHCYSLRRVPASKKEA